MALPSFDLLSDLPEEEQEAAIKEYAARIAELPQGERDELIALLEKIQEAARQRIRPN